MVLFLALSNSARPIEKNTNLSYILKTEILFVASDVTSVWYNKNAFKRLGAIAFKQCSSSVSNQLNELEHFGMFFFSKSWI